MKLKDFAILNTIRESDDVKVYKAKHNTTLKQYAIKLIKKTSKIPNSNYLTTITHNNIIKCYCAKEIVKQSKKHIMYVLEWCNGGSLRDKYNNNGKLTFEYLLQLLEAVNYLHKLGIVHGDLKPENILFSTKGKKTIVKLSDYNTTLGRHNAIAITPEYSPPEYKTYTAKSDIWSIGCILFEFFLKRQPFGSRNEKTTIKTILNNIATMPLSKEIFKIPEPYRYIVYKSLKKDPEKRFKNVEEIISLLRKTPGFLKKVKYSYLYVCAITKNQLF